MSLPQGQGVCFIPLGEGLAPAVIGKCLIDLIFPRRYLAKAGQEDPRTQDSQPTTPHTSTQVFFFIKQLYELRGSNRNPPPLRKGTGWVQLLTLLASSCLQDSPGPTLKDGHQNECTTSSPAHDPGVGGEEEIPEVGAGWWRPHRGFINKRRSLAREVKGLGSRGSGKVACPG